MSQPHLAALATLAFTAIFCAATERGPEVVVVGDARQDVPAPLRPAPGQPIHYLLLGNAEMDYGLPVAHMPRPEPKAMEEELGKVLARQGFVRTQVGGPMPRIALVFSWGTANLDPLGEEDPDTREIDEVAYRFNRMGMKKLVGADRARNLTLVDGEKVDQAIISDRVYVSVIAFDVPELLKRKKVVLWRTHMSIESTHHDLSDSLAVMLASAAPYFGRTTDQPIFIDDRVRQTNVTLGEMQVIGTVPDAADAQNPDQPGRKN